MALNLRLPPPVTEALQAEAERTGQSQQRIVLDLISEHLGLAVDMVTRPDDDRAQARAERVVRAARIPYRRVTARIRLPEGTTSLDLLDRDDRF